MRAWFLIPVLLATGCVTVQADKPPSVSDAELKSAEMRFLSPFMQPRAVVADVIEFDLSPNFHYQIVQPAVSPQIHKFSQRREKGETVYHWTSRGGLQAPLKFWVGQTQLVALRSATMRVRGSGELAFDVTATGNVTEGAQGAELRDWQEFRVAGGAFSRRP